MSLEKRRLKRRYINVYKYVAGECRGQSLALFTEVLSACQEMLFPYEDGQTLAQVAQRGAGVSHFEDIHMLSGCGAGQLAVGGLAGAGAWTQ